MGMPRSKACMLLLLWLVMLMKVAEMANARVYPSSSAIMLRSNNYGMLKEFGYDELKIELYRRRSMEEDDVTIPRVSPGGPDPQHHAVPPRMP